MNPEQYSPTEPDENDSPEKRAWKNDVHYKDLAKGLGLDDESKEVEDQPSAQVSMGREPIRNNEEDFRVGGKSIFAQWAGKLRFKDQKIDHLRDGEEVREEKRQNLH